MIKLGDRAIDKVTGIEGLVTGLVEYLYEKPAVLLESVDKSEHPISTWISKERIEVVKSTSE